MAHDSQELWILRGNNMIKIDFEKTSEDGLMVYRDALYLPEDHTFTEEEVEAMKQERFNRWYAAVTTPPEEYVDDVVVAEMPASDVQV